VRRCTTTRRMVRLALLVSAIVALSLSFGVTPAAADFSVNPPSGSWNGYTIYLSRACHDGNDGIPGGPCIPNSGCNGYNENSQSVATTWDAAAITYYGQGGLRNRGYKTIVGTGTASQNIANSNAAGVNLHVPVHSNAQGDGSPCGGSSSSGNNGTHMLYVSSSGNTCGQKLVSTLGPSSPGTNDRPVYRSNLGELNSTNAVACYVEVEFHTWVTGRNWLIAEEAYAWRIGYGIDVYFGYP